MNFLTNESSVRIAKWRSLLAILCIAAFNLASAQDITFNVRSYQGGYNVSCNGSTDGSIDATIVGGQTPYHYAWSNGATTQDLIGIAAGSYTLTVTDNLGATSSKSVILYEPQEIKVSLTVSSFNGGYQISSYGNTDGSVGADVSGGAPPYTYLWSDSEIEPYIQNLSAGTYSVVVTDENGCTANKTTTLTEPTALSLSVTATTIGSYNTSCSNSQDGSVNLTVSGAVPPYSYNWSNGALTEDIANLSAGTYTVIVIDANSASAQTQITLTSPAALSPTLTPSVYPNNYNISCPSCFNGSVTSSTTGGTSPYSYLWTTSSTGNGSTATSITSAGPGSYSLRVTDSRGCNSTVATILSEPPSDGWNMSGNAIAATDFFGTSNSQPLVMKTNNTEQMRISTTGNVGIGSTNPTAKLDVNGDAKFAGDLTFGANKTLSYLPAGTSTPSVTGWGVVSADLAPIAGLNPCLFPVTPSGINAFSGGISCYGHSAYGGQLNMLNLGYDGANGIIDMVGESNSPSAPRLLINYYCGKDAFICTGSAGNVVMATSATGTVAVGDDYVPAGYRMAVKGKFISEDVTVALRGSWGDYIFEPTYKLMKLDELERYLKANKHLPNIPSASEIENQGINTSEIITELVKKTEELTLYIIEQNKKIIEQNARIASLEKLTH